MLSVENESRLVRWFSMIFREILKPPLLSHCASGHPWMKTEERNVTDYTIRAVLQDPIER